AESSLIAQPPLIHIRIVTRLDAHDASAIVQVGPVEQIVQIDIAPLAAAVADRGRAGEIPNPGFETEIPLRQSAHRTDVHDVCRVGVRQRTSGKNPHFAVVATIENAELAGPGDLVGKADTAGAEDTALLIQHHMGTEWNGLMLLDLVFL